MGTCAEDIQEFTDTVDEVSRLIAGLKEGNLSPEYLDKRIKDREAEKEEKDKQKAEEQQRKEITPERRDELMRKVAALQERRVKRLAARERYDRYVEENPGGHSTDYDKWNMWCPSDEEDAMFDTVRPETPEFRAMEKDIDDRHKRMVEQRQVAERQRVAGNRAFKEGQWSEAYRCYSAGLDAERQNMELHSNAALASLKMGCYLQAREHCNKVLHIAEWLHEDPKHRLCVKALQRRSVANQATGKYAEAVEDLEKALSIVPQDTELDQLIKTARQRAKDFTFQKEIKLKLKLDAQSSKEAPEDSEVKALSRVQAIITELTSSGTGPKSCPKVTGNIQETENVHGLGSQLPSRGAEVNEPMATACSELKGLLEARESCRVLFRESGGIQALSKIVEDDTADQNSQKCSLVHSPTLHALRCLKAVLAGARKPDPSETENLIPRLVSLMSKTTARRRSRVFSEAASLVCTLTEIPEQRKLLVSKLVRRQSDDGTCSAASMVSLMSCVSAKQLASLLKVIGNCAIEASLRSALRDLRSTVGLLLNTVAKSLRSKIDGLVYSAATALANIAMDSSIRRDMVSEKGDVLGSLIGTIVLPSTLPGFCLRACAVALCNVVIEPTVQQALLNRHSNALPALLQFLNHEDLQLVSSAAIVLARIVNQDPIYRILRERGLLDALAPLLVKNWERPAASLEEGEHREILSQIQENAIRVMAIASSKDAETIDRMIESGCVENVIKVLDAKEANDGTLGNAALCISNIALAEKHRPRLRGSKCIQSLIDIAHKRPGMAGRNAGIALARMAQDASCMKTIRDFRGIEILHQCVKP